MLYESYEYEKATAPLFIDFKQGYDKVKKGALQTKHRA